ncbi:uncharacterized protein [Panulirus ornatus]|uniref:uncharacterized protein n=1 Tax=Panulirus ornatus TaxID=150431 RepID=UPI003A894FD5
MDKFLKKYRRENMNCRQRNMAVYIIMFLMMVLSVHSVAGDLLRGVDVPQYAFAGDQATLSCSYDLRATRLYSLKWYHNGTEFYRYVPTERNRPINIHPSHKFPVTELFRNDHRVTLSLTHLTVSASGRYRCEVIAEHPSFRTEASSAHMTVLKEPLMAPLLMGAREIYEPSDLIKIGCQPRQSFLLPHQPRLQWYLEGSKAPPELLTPMVVTDRRHAPGVTLTIPGQQISNSLRAECRLTLGSHSRSSYKTLRVRMRKISYFANYPSSGPLPLASKVTCAIAATILLL